MLFQEFSHLSFELATHCRIEISWDKLEAQPCKCRQSRRLRLQFFLFLETWQLYICKQHRFRREYTCTYFHTKYHWACKVNQNDAFD